jgi:hypothetical protein
MKIQYNQYDFLITRKLGLVDYPWFLPPYRYTGVEDLLASLEKKVISPAAAMARKIEEKRKTLEDDMT